MNKKLVFLTSLSIHVFLFDKSSAQVPLRAKRGEELELTNIETLLTSMTEEGKFDNNLTTTEGNIEGNGEEIEEEKAGLSTAPTITSLDDNYGENIHAEEIPNQNETDNKNITKISDGENITNETVDFDGNSCILREGKGIAYKTKAGESTNEYTNYSMQGLSINLAGNLTEETYDWEETWAENLIPKKVAELKTSTELVPTIETINKTTKTSNTPKEKKTGHPTQPKIPDWSDFVELDGEQPGEEENEDNDLNKKEEITQGEENVLEGIYLEETTHSDHEGKEEEENTKNDEMTTKEKNEEREEVNGKPGEKEEWKKEIKEEEGREENESKNEKQDMSKDEFTNS
uniref:Uncharacterized protein n=1 Tax=Meloidogyne javanica TaxID=6303 RepID=A0A915M0G5_MELJA